MKMNDLANHGSTQVHLTDITETEALAGSDGIIYYQFLPPLHSFIRTECIGMLEKWNGMDWCIQRNQPFMAGSRDPSQLCR